VGSLLVILPTGHQTLRQVGSRTEMLEVSESGADSVVACATGTCPSGGNRDSLIWWQRVAPQREDPWLSRASNSRLPRSMVR
jgi:hypothetical protein